MSSVGLIITGAQLRPDEVTATLGMEPDECWRRGDSKRVGAELHEWGGWKKRLQRRDDRDPFSLELRLWADLLKGKVTELRCLRDAGCNLTLDCFISISGAALVEINPELQRDLSTLGIDLSFAIWASTDAG
ncbi:DUF4279 domain-containing protein [Inhella inkyongensis]|uniref:DUF4279 domain-containing protein n=1 Tax=Inhella inkyongensis TaxID=392593 RepID=UPI0015861C9B|nr:DUF4279 domain-containing protein [Inhella inkyongensis]